MPARSLRSRRARLLAGALVLVALLAGVGVAVSGGDEFPEAIPPPAGGGERRSLGDVAPFNPFAYAPERDEEFLERGRDGLSHPVYELSPGGVPATVARVARFDAQIAAAAGRQGVEPETLGALVFLESAGRPDVAAGDDPRGAVGLAQILPETATSLLGMSVDLEQSLRLTRSIERDRRRARTGRTARGRQAAARRVRAQEARRRRVDQRYDPRAALDGAGRYLSIAERRFGREDLALASYHMGMGNLERVIAAYLGPRRPRSTTKATVESYGITYSRLYFDSDPARNSSTYRRLLGLGDDSRHYLFRLEAAREIRRLAREDPEELNRLVRLHAAKAGNEEVLRPRADNEPFADGDDLEEAYEDDDLLPLPDEPARLGYRIDRGMGEMAPRLDQRPGLYRGLRPEALGTLLFITKEVERLARRSRIRVTSTVRDLRYQRLLTGSNAEATSGFSLHTPGYAIDLRRGVGSRAERGALVHVLERLRALNAIDWVIEPAALHLTAGPEAERFEPLVEALAPELR